MHLSLLSDGYVSDSFNDAGVDAAMPFRASSAVHFAALCRGLIVLVALAVPIGLTLVTAIPHSDPSDQAIAKAAAAPASAIRQKSQG